MIKKLLLLSFFILLSNCSSVKKTQKAINYGNYDQAINIAVKELRHNKTKKKNQEYVLMLEDAFEKAVIKDLEEISFLKTAMDYKFSDEKLKNIEKQLNELQTLIKEAGLTTSKNEPQKGIDYKFLINNLKLK